MNYPNGRKSNNKLLPQRSDTIQGYSNRGMSLEDDINITNAFYRDMDRAIIHKKPTPVQIVGVNYPKRSAAVITEAYFKQASTTDYNGVYRNKYIDFEAKETKNKTRFPLANIHEHQINHMRSVIRHGGISFIILRFAVLNETYYIPAESFFPHWDQQFSRDGKKSVPYKSIAEEGYLIPFHYQARVDYLKVIDQLYF